MVGPRSSTSANVMLGGMITDTVIHSA